MLPLRELVEEAASLDEGRPEGEGGFWTKVKGSLVISPRCIVYYSHIIAKLYDRVQMLTSSAREDRVDQIAHTHTSDL